MDIGNSIAFVVLVILTVSVVIPQILGANTSGWAANDVTIFKTIATIVIVGLLITAARAFGIFEYLRQKRAVWR